MVGTRAHGIIVPMGGADWGELALVSRVDQWISAHPYMFIISRARLVRPLRATATVTGLQALRNRDAIGCRNSILRITRGERCEDVGDEYTCEHRVWEHCVISMTA